MHELAPHIESLFERGGEQKALVRKAKGEVLCAARPQVDTWPISNDTIVVCALGCDTRGQQIPAKLLAYFKALRWCVAIEEAAGWNDIYARRLVAALRRCEAPEALEVDALRRGEDARKIATKAGRRSGRVRRKKTRDAIRNIIDTTTGTHGLTNADIKCRLKLKNIDRSERAIRAHRKAIQQDRKPPKR
jgi:hypothetical protein